MNGPPTRTPEIDLCGDVNHFFRDVVDNVRQSQGYDTTDAAAQYVVALLADYAHPDRFGAESLSRPLTVLFDEAQQSVGLRRFERLRSIGDGVLYLSGFFGEHFERRGITKRYVGLLGARAYRGAGQMLHQSTPDDDPERPGALDLFDELASRFALFVALLEDVADELLAQTGHSNMQLLELYERWLRNGSSALAVALGKQGLTPLRGDPTVH